MNKFIIKYLNKMMGVIQNIDIAEVQKIILALEKCHDEGGVVYVMGNGGSSATASHMANDLSVGIKLREIRNFNVISLADNVPVCTAIANDIGYENIFYAQLKNKLQPQDIVIAISCSGNSKNILKAAHYTKDIGATLIGLSGFDGGQLKEISDIRYHVATENGEYGIVEDVHMMLDHIIYSYYISLKPENKANYTLR
ncbi:TPA: SIS domain-containing protein [Aeromonas dhakensis]|nr:SIS domain-containing protein [Aeromonas dhakensis]